MPIGSWQEPDIKLLLDMPYKITINNQPDLEGWASKLDFGEYEEHELGHYYLLELLKTMMSRI